MVDERRAIVAYLEKRADSIENPPSRFTHTIDRAFAVVLRAIATDIVAGLHIEIEEDNPDD